MEMEEKRVSKVTLVIWLQDLGKEIGRRSSIQSTFVSCNISSLIDRIHTICFPLSNCSYKFMYSLVHN
jgi:hypothetical protein